jgi:hypothetical protein
MKNVLVTISLLVVIGCSSNPFSYHFEQTSEAIGVPSDIPSGLPSDIPSGVPSTTSISGRFTDDFYCVEDSAWVITLPAAIVSVSPGRDLWFSLDEFILQGYSFNGSVMVIKDSNRYLKNYWYK